MNEWMRRYIEDPHAFAAEFETVGKFKAEVSDGAEPSYGEICTAYLEQVLSDLTGEKTPPAAYAPLVLLQSADSSLVLAIDKSAVTIL